MYADISLSTIEPSKSCKLTGEEIEMVVILYSATKFESMKQSVEPEYNKESKSIVVKVSIGF